jgi:small subunit ribosomal protein S16
MVKIRLSRFGSKKHPYYHIVVSDSQAPRDGRFLEQIGTYDPSKPIEQARINLVRVEHWRKTGAQPTDTVKKIIRCSEKLSAAGTAS